MNYELFTLSGKALLDYIKQNCGQEKTTAINFCEDIVLTQKEQENSPLFYQLKQVLADEIKISSADCFAKVYFFVDFNSAFPLKDRQFFDLLFNNGFYLDFGNNEVSRFVPFLSSQSQSKKLRYSFIREDLFYPLQKRLDLDINFEEDIENKSLSFLPKLYAYRALYLSSSKEAFHYNSKLGERFFNEENIIVLPEKPFNPKDKVSVFTAKPIETKNGEVVLSQTEDKAKIEITNFDGEGLITPRCRNWINNYLKKDERGNSFQIRMPFLKGVLHTVDFHAFLRDKGVKGPIFVTDVFGIERDLSKANIIIRPSMFKLLSLVKDKNIAPDLMKYYFEKLRQYNHGIYVVKTEKSFHSTQFVNLSSQQLSTFDLDKNQIDEIVKEHILLADAFCADNLIDENKRKELFSVEDKTDWMKLLLKEPRFINDPHIKTTLKNHRVSRYNDIALGRVLVRGEIRFLSGDLYYFLLDLLKRVAKDNKELLSVYEKIKKTRLYKGGVYLPGGAKDGRRIALVRSPHLSRNEDVGTTVFYKDEYNKYLGHLTGVVMTGDHSFIPSALGGADFDGDTISIIYDKRIIYACFKSGYVETKTKESALPFIHIQELKGSSPIEKYNYVSSQAVYNTFSNRIGNISNAAMKIAAVEYDKAIAKNENTPKAALCTILTGNEIDATKKGVRPYIDSVIHFDNQLDDEAKAVVKEIEDYIRMKREIENKRGNIPSVKADNDTLILKDSSLPVTVFRPNFNRNAVAQLLYRWADAFLGFKSGVSSKMSKKAFNALNEIFGYSIKNPICEKILSAFVAATSAYSSLLKSRDFTENAKSGNRAKITVRLSGQYDDIYSYTNTIPSFKDKIEGLEKEIYKATSSATIDELYDFIRLLFTEAEGEFNPGVFWPYVKEKGVKDHPLFKAIMQLENAEMLLNFEYEGYRLLNYLLNNALLDRKLKALEIESEGLNGFEKKYLNLVKENIGSKLSASGFEKKLRKIALMDLANAEGITELNTDTKTDLITRLYPQQDENNLKAFWKIFTEAEVINALGGQADA